MSAKFDVDFSEALRQLAEFQAKTKGLGKALDDVQASAGKPAGAAAKLIKDMHKHYSDLEKALIQAGVNSEAAGEAMKRSRQTAQGLFQGLATESLKMTTLARAYNGELRELDRLLGDTSAKATFIKWAEKTRNLNNELVGQNKYLQASLKALDTAEAKHNEILKVSLATKKHIQTSDIRQQAENLKLRASEAELNTALGQGLVVRKAKLAAAKNEIAESVKLNSKLGETRRAYDGLNGGIQAQIAAQQALNQGIAAGVTFRQREQNQVDELRRRHESLNGGLAEQAAQLKVLNSAREKEITELTRERAKIEELTRSLASLNGGEQEQIAKLNARIAARRRAIVEDQQSIGVMEALSASAARLIVADERQRASLEAKNKATMEQARSQQRMTKAEAEALAKTEALAAANKRHADALLDEARKAHGMSRAQMELTQAREREIERLTRLKAQKDMLNSSYGREVAAIQAQIVEQQRYNRMLGMTTAQLLGFASAQKTASASMQMGSQSAAMLRAGLAGLHTNIGMYTSATIVAASATYAIASALRSTVEIGAEFSATMARTNAIMNGNQPFWLQDTGAMAAMEQQVRALGQSTIYTASEVAGGLTELGMAGLSASDAIVALRPALDMATIGGISMAQSADIATNVMMTFGMQAKDLGEVVDVMATAVTSSNTNIEQLANALTYAGPAAQTAGISMRDTVAAIEALANSGIKASRSGTALRRLFVSILNPTKKGKEMMAEYGISVLDAEGKTRGLTDIIGQLNEKLGHLSGADRLSAIQNLVGVYATSPIAALVEQADNLKDLRRGLDDVAGAAERMRDKISDGLKYDWKEVISSFEEVKLAAFDNVEGRLRLASASLSKMLVDLTVPLSEGDSLTQLDLILARAESTAVALAQMVGGILAFKFASGNVASAFSADTKALGEGLNILSARAAATGASMSTLASQVQRTNGTLGVQASLAAGAAGALSTFSTSAAVAAGWMSKLAAGASVLMRALGWVGLIYGIGSALVTVFGSDSEEAARAHKDEVDAVKKSYDDLKASIKEVALAKERDALAAQIKSEQGKIDQTLERKTRLPGLIEEGKRQNLPTDLLEAEYANLDKQIARYRENIKNAEGSLAGLNTTDADRISLLQQQEAQITAVSAAQKAYNEALDAANRGNNYSAARNAAVEELHQNLLKARAAVVSTAEAAKSVEDRMQSLSDLAAADAITKRSELTVAAYEKEMTSAEKLISLQSQRAEVETKISDLLAREKAGPTSEETRLPGLDEYVRLREQLHGVLEKEAEAYAEVQKTAKSLEEAQAAVAWFHMTEEQQLAELEKQLVAVNNERAVYNHLLQYGSEALASEFEVDRLKRELDLLQQIRSLRGSVEKKDKPGRTGKSEAERAAEKAAREAKQALDAAQSTYDSLRQSFDPLGASLDATAKKKEQLQLLMEKGRITAENQAQALDELARAHHKLTLEQDRNYQSLENLRESYSQSPFSETLDDLVELNRLLREGAISMEEHSRLAGVMKRQAREDALSGAPTASLDMGQASSSPFTDWMSTEMERAQGLGWYDKRGKELGEGYDLDKFNIEQEADKARKEAALLSEQAHSDALIKIEKDRMDALTAAKASFNDQSRTLDESRHAYAEQMNTMVTMSMLSTAQNVLGMFASAGEDATAAQKVAFAAQQALAVAQIIMYTHLAAARAEAELGTVAGPAMAAKILTMGYINAGIVGGLAVAKMSGAGGDSAGGGSSYAGAYDKGGVIPYGQYGIVGEYGPEIVQGPAHVTGREATAKKLSGGSEEYNITLAPQIVIHSGDGGSGQADPQKARELAESVRGIVMSTMKEQTRPGGALDTWIKSQRR